MASTRPDVTLQRCRWIPRFLSDSGRLMACGSMVKDSQPDAPWKAEKSPNHASWCMRVPGRGRVKYATVDTSWTRCAPVRARIFVRIPVSSLFLLRGLNQMLHYNSPAPLALALTPTPLALTPAPNALEVQVSSVKYSSYLPLLFFLGKI